MAAGEIDIGAYRALQESAGAEFVADLVDAFLDDAPRMIATMSAALAAGDEAAFRRAAHSLKSNSMTFGATTLAAMARALEVNAHDVVERRDAAQVNAVADEERRVASALRELRDA